MKLKVLLFCAAICFAHTDAHIISWIKGLKETKPTLPPAKEVSREIIKEVPVIKEVPITKEIIKEVPQEVIRRVPIDKIVYVDKPVEVIKEVIVDKLVPVPRAVEVIKEVPVEKVTYTHFSLLLYLNNIFHINCHFSPLLL